MGEGQFHNLADEAIEDIQDAVEELEDDMNDLEVDYASGVLNIVLGPHGTWVINKQTPNRQIWWSSPIRSVDRCLI